MTTKPRFILIVVLLLGAAGVGIIFWRQTTPAPSRKTAEAQPQAAKPGDVPTEPKKETPGRKLNMTYLPTHSPGRVKQIIEDIEQALASGDLGAMRRAMNMAAYNRGFKNSEIQEALKKYLDHADAYVRFSAAEYLYITGDNGGKDVLLGIMQSPKAIMVYGFDLRPQAAEALAKYRETSALGDLITFYKQSKDSGLLHGILMMTEGSVPGGLIDAQQALGKSNSGLFMLSQLNPSLAKTKASAAFLNPKVPENYEEQIRNTAAWVMLVRGQLKPARAGHFKTGHAEGLHLGRRQSL